MAFLAALLAVVAFRPDWTVLVVALLAGLFGTTIAWFRQSLRWRNEQLARLRAELEDEIRRR